MSQSSLPGAVDIICIVYSVRVKLHSLIVTHWQLWHIIHLSASLVATALLLGLISTAH